MRVFVGIPLNQELKSKAVNWQAEHQKLPVRWMQKKNMHITLVPPWREANIAQVLRNLAAVKNAITPFSITFRHIDFGTNPRHPRLIWATGDAPEELTELANAVHRALGFSVPDKKPLLHTTIARFRPENFPSFPAKKLDEKADWSMTVDKIALFESRLSPRGADYVVLGEVPLVRK